MSSSPIISISVKTAAKTADSLIPFIAISPMTRIIPTLATGAGTFTYSLRYPANPWESAAADAIPPRIIAKPISTDNHRRPKAL